MVTMAVVAAAAAEGDNESRVGRHELVGRSRKPLLLLGHDHGSQRACGRGGGGVGGRVIESGVHCFHVDCTSAYYFNRL